MGNNLIYFVKYPTPGKVKTRLAKTLGPEEAALKYQKLAESNLKNLNSLLDENLMITIAFDPPDSLNETRSWLKGRYAYLPQEGCDLGKRLENAFSHAFQRDAGKVLAVGSDTLGLHADHVREALLALENHDVVLGPARDGGYYLIGTSCHEPHLFHEIPWSTSSVLSRTLSRIQEKKLTFNLLEELEDLDE